MRLEWEQEINYIKVQAFIINKNNDVYTFGFTSCVV